MNTVSGRLGNWAAGLPSVCGWTKLLERPWREWERERVMYEKKVYADYVDCRCTRKLPRKCGDSPRKGKAWYVSCLKHGIWAMVIPALLEILLLAMGYGIQLLTTAPFMQVLRGRAHHQGWKVASRADRGQMGQESKLITHHSFRLSTIAMLRSVFVRAQALNLFATCPFRWKQIFLRRIARGKDRGLASILSTRNVPREDLLRCHSRFGPARRGSGASRVGDFGCLDGMAWAPKVPGYQEDPKSWEAESVGTSECREVLLWCYRSLSIPRLWGIWGSRSPLHIYQRQVRDVPFLSPGRCGQELRMSQCLWEITGAAWGPKVPRYQRHRNFLRSWKSGESLRVKDGAIVGTMSFHPTAAGKWRKSKVRRKCSVPFAWLPTRAREDGKARAANVSVPRRKRSGARGWWRRRRCASAHRSWRRSTDPSCSI